MVWDKDPSECVCSCTAKELVSLRTQRECKPNLQIVQDRKELTDVTVKIMVAAPPEWRIHVVFPHHVPVVSAILFSLASFFCVASEIVLFSLLYSADFHFSPSLIKKKKKSKDLLESQALSITCLSGRGLTQIPLLGHFT